MLNARLPIYRFAIASCSERETINPWWRETKNASRSTGPMGRKERGMGKTVKLLISCVLLAGSAAFANAQDARITKILGYKPHQEGVVYAIPTPQQMAGLKLELVKDLERGGNGWLLVDAQGQPLRRFFDTDGDKQIDPWSYYLDGVEIYREI